MTSNATKFLAIAAIAFTGSLPGSPALAQVYRIVGPDGKVTFSDQPPPAASTSKVVPGASASSANNSTLPFELRQVASKYPVTLYTGDNCVPCGSARNLLSSRGIPFTEKTVKSDRDIQALQRLSGENSLPFATIGSQQLKGFSDSEWVQFLDAAGYPKTSMLPANYRQVPASPMTVVAAPPATPAANDASANPVPSAPPPPAANNPAGIRF